MQHSCAIMDASRIAMYVDGHFQQALLVVCYLVLS